MTRREDLPAKAHCRACDKDKPIAEMVVIRNRGGSFYIRPRCKDCYNARERGHRREWKREYARKWRRRNFDAELGYRAKQKTDEGRARAAANAMRRFKKDHDAILIQGRLRRKAGMHVSTEEARQLAKTYGCCYPTRFGLTASGLREFERIRSSIRRTHDKHPPSAVEIRMMVYADSKAFFIKPRLQKQPYQDAAAKLRALQAKKKAQRDAQIRRAA
jgi:hypothetical protein